MSIQEIVEQAIKTGYLTPVMEAEVSKICDTSTDLTLEQYTALDKLMGALLTGEVTAMPRKQFINVMEELVVTQVISLVAEIETTSDFSLDVGDISAYALNRLPPLYATTEEGANYQREKARENLQDLIKKQVEESLSVYLNRPEFHPSRNPISRSESNMFNQVSNLLQSFAPNFEKKSDN